MQTLGIVTIVTLIIFLTHSRALAQSSFTYEGRLFTTAGTPVLDSVSLKFQILNPAGTCVLYEEVQSGVDLTASKGAFSLSVGSAASDAKRSANFRGAYNPSMISVFRNSSTLSSIPVAGCAAGTYTAGASDTRLLRVEVTKSGTTEVLSPDLVINAVPNAQVAQSLQGYLPSDFLRLDAANGISGNIGLTAIGTGAGQTREFRFYELAANGSDYFALKAPDAMTTALTYVFPSGSPTVGQILSASAPAAGVVTLSWTNDAGAGGGISNINGSTQSSQSFAAIDIAAAITAPAWSTNVGTGAHTLQIPMAFGAGVTGGLITKVEHTAFTAKVDRAGDTMTGNLTLSGTAGVAITGTGTIAMGTNKITALADPTANQEAATKAYVDSVSSAAAGNYVLKNGTVPLTANWSAGAFTISANGFATGAQAGLAVSPYNTGAGQTGEVRLLELAANGTNYVGFKAPDDAGASNLIYRLPATAPTAGQVLTAAVPAAGVSDLTWGSAAGTLSGLTASRIPYAATATSLTDSANLSFNATTGAISVGGTAPSITSSDAITIAAGGANKNVVLTPSGTGYTLLGGNVGIGIAAPNAKLALHNDATNYANTDTFVAQITRNGGNGNLLNLVNTSAGGDAILGFSTSAAIGMTAFVSGAYEGTNSNTALVFGTWNDTQSYTAEKMRITGLGYVGIKNDDPQARLDVSGSGIEATFRVYDKVAISGITKAIIRAGAAQAATNLLEFQTKPGALLSSFSSTGYLTLPGAPTVGAHAATKDYVDTAIGGVSGISGLTAGRVTLSTAATTVGDSANLTFNSTTGAMGIGGTSPTITAAGNLLAIGTNFELRDGGTADTTAVRLFSNAQSLYTNVTGFAVRTLTGQPSFNLSTTATSPAMTITRAAGGTVDLGITAGGGTFFTSGVNAGDAILRYGAANAFRIGNAAGGAPSFTIDSSGNVGIGVTAPAEILTVKSASSTVMSWINPADAEIGKVGQGNSLFVSTNGDDLGIRAAKNLYVGTNAGTTPKLTILTGGNVGIGAVGPVDPLSIGTAINASATRASVNLSNTALVGGSANGTYVGANPPAFTGNFIDLQVAGVSKFKVSGAGVITGDGSGLTGVTASAAGSSGDLQYNNGSGVTTASSSLNWNSASGLLTVNAGNSANGININSGRLLSATNDANEYMLVQARNVDSGGTTTMGASNNGGATVADTLAIKAYGSTVSTSGAVVADGSGLIAGSGLAGGLSIGAEHASGEMRFYTGGVAAGNERLRILSDGKVGIGTVAPVDPLSLGLAINASATRASLNLSNTALVGGSANGTYVGANPAAFTGNFIDLQVAGASKFSISATGFVTLPGAPTVAAHAATKAYVDTAISGVSGTLSSLTAGRIPYAATASTLTDSVNLSFNATTGAITVGGTAPSITSGDAMTIAAGGTNKNVILTPSGTGYTVLGGSVGIGSLTPVDNLSIGTAIVASATRASLNLSNTAIVSGSANGTYVGANPAAFTGNFIDLQVNGTSKFKVTAAGVITGDGSGLTGVTATPAFTGLTAGGIPYATNTTTLSTADAANFSWDATNHRLGVGTAAPGYKLDISAGNDDAIRIRNSAVGANNNNGLAIVSGGSTPIIDFAGASLTIKNNTYAGLGGWNGGANIAMTVLSGGNVGIGTATPQEKLDVNGNIRVAKNTVQPYACDATHDGVLALTSGYRHCVCKGGTTTWVFTSDGTTTCTW